MPNNGSNNDPKTGSYSEGRVFDKTTVTLLVAGFAAIGLTALIVKTTPRELPHLLGGSQKAGVSAAVTPKAPDNDTAMVVWATSAPGRVEPKGGDIKVRPEAAGRIVKVYVSAGDKVRHGDLIAQLRDDEVLARLAQARAEVAVRVRERDEEKEKNAAVLARRKAADELGAAERAVHVAWIAFDKAVLDQRAGRGSTEAIAAARQAIPKAEDEVTAKSDALMLIADQAGTPLPTRLDSGLTLARADLRLAEIAFGNTRVRAPVDGTLLRFDAKLGETAAPNQSQPIAVLGDLSAIQITAEVPERDVSKVRVGQAVIVRSNAFGSKEFRGVVKDVAPSVGAPGLRAQGPRQQLDAEVLEVTIELEGTPQVLPGMRVDVFFKSEQQVSAIIRKK